MSEHGMWCFNNFNTMIRLISASFISLFVTKNTPRCLISVLLVNILSPIDEPVNDKSSIIKLQLSDKNKFPVNVIYYY